jgi:hypothetical protein
MHRTFSLLFAPLLAGAFLCTQHAAAQSASAAPVVAATVSAGPASAAPAADTPLPTALDILQKYQAAIGGKDAWSGITTRSMKGIY